VDSQKGNRLTAAVDTFRKKTIMATQSGTSPGLVSVDGSLTDVGGDLGGGFADVGGDLGGLRLEIAPQPDELLVLGGKGLIHTQSKHAKTEIHNLQEQNNHLIHFFSFSVLFFPSKTQTKLK